MERGRRQVVWRFCYTRDQDILLLCSRRSQRLTLESVMGDSINTARTEGLCHLPLVHCHDVLLFEFGHPESNIGKGKPHSFLSSVCCPVEAYYAVFDHGVDSEFCFGSLHIFKRSECRVELWCQRGPSITLLRHGRRLAFNRRGRSVRSVLSREEDPSIGSDLVEQPVAININQ